MTSYGKLRVDTPSNREARFVRAFAATPEGIWKAFTDPVLSRRWLTMQGWTMPVCEIDARPGGKFRYVWHDQDGNEMGMGGTFRELAPPSRMVHTELFDQDWTGGQTVVTTEISGDESGAETTVTLTVAYTSTEARDGALATPMCEGMEGSYARLEALLME